MQDLEESLATAIAQIEIERIRVKRLRAENVHLKTVLRTHGITPGDAVDVAAERAEDDAREVQAAAAHTSRQSSQDDAHQHVHDVDYEATIVAGGVEVHAYFSSTLSAAEMGNVAASHAQQTSHRGR